VPLQHLVPFHFLPHSLPWLCIRSQSQGPLSKFSWRSRECCELPQQILAEPYWPMVSGAFWVENWNPQIIRYTLQSVWALQHTSIVFLRRMVSSRQRKCQWCTTSSPDVSKYQPHSHDTSRISVSVLRNITQPIHIQSSKWVYCIPRAFTHTLRHHLRHNGGRIYTKMPTASGRQKRTTPGVRQETNTQCST